MVSALEAVLPRIFSVLLLFILHSALAQQSMNTIPYINLNASGKGSFQALGHLDDGSSEAIFVNGAGFPFGDTYHSVIYIVTNGIISFDQPVYSTSTSRFPSNRNDIHNLFIVAPFWDDVDIRRSGNIFYKVFTTLSDDAGVMVMVNDYIFRETGKAFYGEWMLVVTWDHVHPWHHRNSSSDFYTDFPDYIKENTLQAILISNGTDSYAIFTYQCGDINWSWRTVIGYNAAGVVYMNHPLSGGSLAGDIDCTNIPESNWTNILYNLTGSILNITVPDNIEPPQNDYLPTYDLLYVNTTGTLNRCTECTSVAIDLGIPGIPFGNYYHQTAYVGVNGIISFDRSFKLSYAEIFPSVTGSVLLSYLVAPFWSNVDTRLAGSVQYETYKMGDAEESDSRLHRVSRFIHLEQDPNFEGTWMLLVNWEDVHPFPHGASEELDRQDPYLESKNSFQAIIIASLSKTYAVYTYGCNNLTWSDEATIGYNAAGDYYMNHPLTGELHANIIGCLHENEGVMFNNVIYDLVPSNNLTISTPPPPQSTLGSCAAYRASDCCDSGPSCLGNPPDCSCDEFCHFANDCCHDIARFCTIAPPPNNDTFLIFANRPYINRINFDGNYFHTLSENVGQIARGIDFDYRNQLIYWSDARADQIIRSKFDGSDVTVIANASHGDVEDIALDWIGNNLYWTESATGNIEVLNLDTFERTILLTIGGSYAPHGICLDPNTRQIFWTALGYSAKIEMMSMDGKNRRVLHSSGLIWPNGITLDYDTRRIYWIDAHLDRIEYSYYNGSQRTVLASDLSHPFALTIYESLVFWTDWAHNSLFSTHKERSLGIRIVRDFLRGEPYGIEAVAISRQQNVENPCQDKPCPHICLLSSTESSGYKCVCPKGSTLLINGTSCMTSLDSKSPHANNGAIDGGIIGTLAIFVIILAGAVGVVWFLKRRTKKKEAYEHFGHEAEGDEVAVKSSDDHQASFDNPLYEETVVSDNDTQVNLFDPERKEDLTMNTSL